ncbi:MAG: glutamate racemase [Minisyncoccota bacterium]
MIGIFDSGSGGLTVLRAIREQMPRADILYFGDIKNAPYGSRSRAELSQLTIAAIERLQRHGAHDIVSACNSVSASLVLSLFDTLSIAPDSLIEMVGPTVSHFKDSQSRILLVATPATISSEIYQNAFHMIGKEIDAVAIPALAGAIESGAKDAEIETIIRDALGSVEKEKYDECVLACTHYPLVQPVFERVLGNRIAIFDPASAVASRVKQKFGSQEIGDGRLHFIISEDAMPFRARVAEFFPGDDVVIEVIQ